MARTSKGTARARALWVTGGGAVLLLGLLVGLALYWSGPRPVEVSTLELAVLEGEGLRQADAARLFEETVASTPGLRHRPAEGARPPSPGSVQLVLALSWAQASSFVGLEPVPGTTGDGRDDVAAFADLEVVSRLADGVERYPCFGRGRSADAQERRVEVAVEAALRDALACAVPQARALQRPSAVLEQDLRSPDESVRLAALAVLSARGHASAVEPLLEQLRSEDLMRVRRAMGGLVRLRERRAVPLLIDVSRGKHPLFQREVVYALAEIGGEEAEAYLFTLVEGHEDEAIRTAAREALESISRRHQKEAR